MTPRDAEEIRSYTLPYSAIGWVTVEYNNLSSNAHVCYTKRTDEIRHYEWVVGFRPATELEIAAELERRRQTAPEIRDWRDNDMIRELMQYEPLKALE